MDDRFTKEYFEKLSGYHIDQEEHLISITGVRNKVPPITLGARLPIILARNAPASCRASYP